MAPTVTAFDLTPSDCKVLQLVRQKTIQLRRGLVISFSGLSGEGEELATAKAQCIREALRHHKIQPINPVLVLPKHSATVRSVFLPSTEDAELEEMARFESQKIIPFNVERHVISHAVLTKESISGSRVLISAVDEPILAEPLSILTKAGIDPVCVDVSSLCLVNAWRSDNPDPPQGLCALVNIGSVHTDISLLNNGVLLTTRSVLFGTRNLLNAMAFSFAVADTPSALFDTSNLLEAPPQAPPGMRTLETLDLFDLDAREPGRFRVKPEAPVSPSIFSCPSASKQTHSSGPAASETPSTAAGLPANLLTAKVTENAVAESQQPDSTETPGIWLPHAEEPEFQIIKDSPSENNDTNGPAAEAMRQWIGRILKEIRLTCDFARREYVVATLDSIRVSGEGALIQGLDQSLTVTLGCEVTPFNPLVGLTAASRQPALDERLYPIFAQAQGAALHELWSETYPINLLPSAMVKRQEQQALRLSLALLGALGLVLLTIGYLYFSELTTWREERLRRYKEYNKELAPAVRDVKDKVRKLKIIEERQRDRASALAILDAISAYPKIGPVLKNGRIVLLNFKYTSGGEVEIEGHAVDIPDINDFVTYLGNMTIKDKKVFSQIRILQQSPQSLSGRQQNALRYRLSCQLIEGSARGGGRVSQ